MLTIVDVTDIDLYVVLVFINHCIAGITEDNHESLSILSDVIIFDWDNDPHLRGVDREY